MASTVGAMAMAPLAAHVATLPHSASAYRRRGRARLPPGLAFPHACCSRPTRRQRAAAPAVRAEGAGPSSSSSSSGGSGTSFALGFALGGAVFGALGFIFAPQLSRALLGEGGAGGTRSRLRSFLEDEDGSLESTRRSLNEKIAQLNTAIDDVSAQLRSDDDVVSAAKNSINSTAP
eukprot:jgi/Chlat1/2527/Chrsp175S02384